MKKLISFLIAVIVWSAIMLVYADIPDGCTCLGSYSGSEDLKFVSTTSSGNANGLTITKSAALPWKDSSDTGYYIGGTTTGALDEASNLGGYADIKKVQGAVKTYAKTTLEFDFMLTENNTTISVRYQQKSSSGSNVTTTHLKLTAGKDITANTWNRAAVTYGTDGIVTDYTIYLNGKLYDSGKTAEGQYGLNLIKIQPITTGICEFGMYLDNILLYAGDSGYECSGISPVSGVGKCSLYGSEIVIPDGFTAEDMLNELELNSGCLANIYDSDGNAKSGKINVDTDYLAASNPEGIYTYYKFRQEKFYAGDISAYTISSKGVKSYDKFCDGTFYASVDASAEFCKKNFTLILVQYDSNKKIIGMNAKTQTVDNKTETIGTSLTLEKGHSGGFVKAMIWTDISELKPLGSSKLVDTYYNIDGFSEAKIYFPGFKLKAATFSVDDGSSTDSRIIEILDKNGLKGTFNIITQKFYEQSDTVKNSYLERYKGHEIASHSRYHSAFYMDNPDGGYDGNGNPIPYMSKDDVLDELLASKNDVQSLTGKENIGLAWPRKAPSDRADYAEILAELPQIYEYARDISYTKNFELPSDWYQWSCTCRLVMLESKKTSEYANEFVQYDTDGKRALFSAWGHAADITSEEYWQIFEEACEILGTSNDIWPATNLEIALYDKAAENLIIDSDKNTITNSSNIDIYAALDGVQVIIPANSVVNFN